MVKVRLGGALMLSNPSTVTFQAYLSMINCQSLAVLGNWSNALRMRVAFGEISYSIHRYLSLSIIQFLIAALPSSPPSR
jgi:hypothetical protein